MKTIAICLASAVLLLTESTCSFAEPQLAENKSLIEKNISVSHSIDGIAIAEIDLGTLQLGTIYKTTVVLQNKFESPLEFLKASVSCSCVSVVVPKVKLGSGVSEKLVFDFAVGGDERSTLKSYDVEIQTSGAAERILLRFKARIDGVVAFDEDIAVFELCPRESLNSVEDSSLRQLKRIRIITSDIDLLRNAVLEKTESIKELLDANISIVDGNAFLELQAKTIPALDRTIKGSVILRGSDFTTKSIGVAVRQKLPIECYPNVLIFGSRNDDEMSATAIVRLRKPEMVNPEDALSVICTFSNGEQIDSTLTRLTAGIYRVTLVIPKSTTKKYSSSTTELNMTFKSTKLGDELSTKARFRW